MMIIEYSIQVVFQVSCSRYINPSKNVENIFLSSIFVYLLWTVHKVLSITIRFFIFSNVHKELYEQA